MTIDFNALRTRAGNGVAALQKTLEKTEGGGYKKDPRIWKPVNKEGKSSNIIRFLPIPYVDLVAVEEGRYKEEDLTPMAKIIKHYFQGPKGWYVNNSPQTFGEADPVREHDQPLWKKQKETDDKALKDVLMKRLPNTEYTAGILVIKDSQNPENNGKIMLYEFGETVRKLIEKADNPEFETDAKFDPFDPFNGRDLILNLTYEKKMIGNREATVPNFTNVKWSDPRPLGDDAEIERIWKASHSIMDFYDRKNFKTYDQLKEQFCKIMGIDLNFNPLAAGSSIGNNAEEFLKQQTAAPAPAPAAAPAPAPAPATQTQTTAPATTAAEPAAAPAPSQPASSGGGSSMDEFEAMLLNG